MSERRESTHRLRRLLRSGVAVAAAAALTMTLAACGAAAEQTPAAAPVATPSATPGAGATEGFQDPVNQATQAPVSGTRAVRVEIPAIGVDSGLEQLPLDSTGVLTPPVEWQSAGWYKDGVLPGRTGPAVIAGHVDSNAGPAVFFELGDLVAGDEVRVTLSDGSTATFAVDRTETAPKDAFPTAAVYGPTPDSQLRLITCDGLFDQGTGHYVDNMIVFASRINP